MNEWLGTVLGISLPVSLLALLLLALTPLLRRRYASRWRYRIWLVLALRLLIPFNVSLPVPVVQLPLPELIPVADAATSQPDSAPVAAEIVPDEAQTTSLAVSPGQAAAVVWIAGSALFLLYNLGGYALFLFRARKGSQPLAGEPLQQYRGIAEELGIPNPPALFSWSELRSPMLMGIFRPRVYLSTEGLDHRETGLILRHELIHYRHRDTWGKLLFLLCRAAHWWNPVVHRMAVQADRDMELACDDEVVRGSDSDIRSLYGDTILSILRDNLRRGPVLSTYFKGTGTAIKQRLQNLFNHTTLRRGITVFLASFLAVLLAGGTVVLTPTVASAGSNTTKIGVDSATGMKIYNIDGTVWYLVENEAQLRSIGNSREALSRNYRQAGSIELQSEWSPIGSSDSPFTGQYDGYRYQISGLKISSSNTQNAGLFGVAENAVVRNVILSDPQNAARPGLTGSSAVVALNIDSRVTGCQAVYSAADPDGGTLTLTYGALHYYDEGDMHPYIHYRFRNDTDDTVIAYQMAYLLFDKDGNPVEVDWWNMTGVPSDLRDRTHLNEDSDFFDYEPHYVYPGEEFNINGGWSLKDRWEDPHPVAYAIVTLKSVQFRSSGVWTNPEYDRWLQAYHNKQVNPETLAGYYPYELTIR